MAFGWQREPSLEEWLFAEPFRFDFFQAVRLLEKLAPDAVPPGQASEPEKEAVRFRSRVALDFPASDIQRLAPSPEPGAPPEMTVNFMGLAGAFGPMAMPDTELVLDRIRAKDFAARDFLDIFNHRLLSLVYQVRKRYRLTLTNQSPEETPVARHLYSFFGLGLDSLRGRMRIPDRTLLATAGILAQHPRSAVGLERLLACHFQVPATVRQLTGCWRPLESSEWTLIGKLRGRNQRLGETAVAGTRIWDQQGAFLVSLGPLSQAEFRDFLPNGTAWLPLRELTRFYAGPEFEFGFRLILKAAEVPEMRLGHTFLGWTSWLKTRPFPHDDSQVRLKSS
ncbi:MAG TPA: type VI secretion system baseplate subunit TssG [Bryobacteraceae bacterium]|nr:type VI secretion system baseplate subunit TssG [Bryobacteraceae bacterium]